VQYKKNVVKFHNSDLILLLSKSFVLFFLSSCLFFVVSLALLKHRTLHGSVITYSLVISPHNRNTTQQHRKYWFSESNLQLKC